MAARFCCCWCRPCCLLLRTFCVLLVASCVLYTCCLLFVAFSLLLLVACCVLPIPRCFLCLACCKLFDVLSCFVVACCLTLVPCSGCCLCLLYMRTRAKSPHTLTRGRWQLFLPVVLNVESLYKKIRLNCLNCTYLKLVQIATPKTRCKMAIRKLCPAIASNSIEKINKSNENTKKTHAGKHSQQRLLLYLRGRSRGLNTTYFKQPFGCLGAFPAPT